MSKQQDGCLSKTASMSKQAEGVTIYLLEELGDARLRLSQLKAYIKEGLDLIENSEKRDHFFEVAAHLLHGVPDTLFKMEKALNAAAMAAARIDYEEIKQTLKPEKADELEGVLPDVRLRYLKRRSQETPMTPKQAAEQLLAIADETEVTGQVPLAQVWSLLASLEERQTKTASESKDQAFAFRAFAKTLENHPNRSVLVERLRRIVAENLQPTMAQVAASIYQTASSREQVMDGFAKANPHMSEEDLEKAADMWEKHKDSLKTAASTTAEAQTTVASSPESFVREIERFARAADRLAQSWEPMYERLGGEGYPDYLPSFDEFAHDLSIWHNKVKRAASEVKSAATLEGVQSWKKELLSETKQATMLTVSEVEAQTARFQEGKPADPTENMSEEDKAEWWEKHEEHKDNFKEKSARSWKL